MMRILPILATLFAVHTSLSISAQTVLAEDFNGQTTNANLAGQNSWTKAGSGPDVTVQNMAPVRSGYGAYVQMPAGNATPSRVYKNFVTTSAGTNTFYYSLQLNISAAAAASTGYFISLGDPGTGTNYFARLFARTSGSGYVLGGSKSSTTATYGSTVLNYGTTYRVVVRYSFVGSVASDDQMYIWINPVMTSTPPATSAAEVAITSGTDVSLTGGNTGTFHWHNSDATNPAGKFDQVVVSLGTTPASAWSNQLFGLEIITPLPVSIASVTASRNTAGVQVAWNTAEESNIRQYEVEKSADGQNFIPAAVVDGKGNGTSNLQYSWLDQQPLEGTNYYRIRVVEQSGNTSYSRIVTVSTTGIKDARFTLSPNPAQAPVVTANIQVPEAGTYTMEVFDAMGRKIRSEKLLLSIGNTSNSLELSGAAPGLYTVRLTGQGIDLHQSLVVGAR